MTAGRSTPLAPGLPRGLLALALLAYAALVVRSIAGFGVQYEEAVSYVLHPMDVVASIERSDGTTIARYTDGRSSSRAPAPTGRWVVSTAMPRLSLRVGATRLPVLSQLYMTQHLSYLSLLAAAWTDPVWGARLVHALLGLLAVLLVCDVGRHFLSDEAAALAALLAATSLPFTFMFSWARYEESLPSVASLAVLAALLRHRRDGGDRWLLLAALAAGLGVSGKITTLWPLGALALAAGLAGARPRWSARTLIPCALVAGIWLVPMLAFALLAPGDATGHEAHRRLAFLSDLLTTDVIPRTLANMVAFLGGWGGLLREILRGPGLAGPSLAGRAVVVATLGHLAYAALRPGPTPRRRRFETAALVFLGSNAALIAMFYREHQDYQFILVVPYFSLAVAALVESLARAVGRALGPARRPLAAAAAALGIAALPLGCNLREQADYGHDLAHVQNAMLDLHVQRASAGELLRRGITRPITTTFYALGQYEFLTRDRVHPLHVQHLFRDRRLGAEELRRLWRDLLALPGGATRFVLLPTGRNVVEERHFPERAIRDAFLAEASLAPGGVERLQRFSNAAGDTLLELYRVGGPGPTPGRD